MVPGGSMLRYGRLGATDSAEHARDLSELMLFLRLAKERQSYLRLTTISFLTTYAELYG
jgi:hypothetical protein